MFDENLEVWKFWEIGNFEYKFYGKKIIFSRLWSQNLKKMILKRSIFKLKLVWFPVARGISFFISDNFFLIFIIISKIVDFAFSRGWFFSTFRRQNSKLKKKSNFFIKLVFKIKIIPALPVSIFVKIVVVKIL